MNKMKSKCIILSLMLLSFGIVRSQVGVAVGPSFLKGFQYPSIFTGLSISGEYATSDESSVYGKISYFFNNKEVGTPVTLEAIDFSTTPQITSVSSDQTFNYLNLSFGRRSYFIESYDYGFAFYGGSLFTVAFNSAKYQLGDYDANLYRPAINGQVSDGQGTKGTIINLGIGLNGGLKNSFEFGTVFLDVDLTYYILSLPNNDVATTVADKFYSPLVFNFNVGFRKDLYFNSKK